MYFMEVAIGQTKAYKKNIHPITKEAIVDKGYDMYFDLTADHHYTYNESSVGSTEVAIGFLSLKEKDKMISKIFVKPANRGAKKDGMSIYQKFLEFAVSRDYKKVYVNTYNIKGIISYLNGDWTPKEIVKLNGTTYLSMKYEKGSSKKFNEEYAD